MRSSDAFARLEEKFGTIESAGSDTLYGEHTVLQGLLTLNQLALPPVDADDSVELGGRIFLVALSELSG